MPIWPEQDFAKVPPQRSRFVCLSVKSRRFVSSGHPRAGRGVKMGRPPQLTPHQVKEALLRRDTGEPLRDIARSYNVSHSTISKVGGCAMMLSTTMILEFLVEKPGRYIQHYMGDYCMKDAIGAAVTVREEGKDFPIKPTAEQMDGLEAASHLVCHGSKYTAAPA
jgi:hypothetical protein